MSIVGVETLIYGVDDLDAASKFQADWGMEKVAANAKGVDFRLRNNTFVKLRPATDAGLKPATIR